MSGTILQSDGQASIGASIKATHIPSGTVYGGSTNESGRFNLANMRVGGPYTVEITYVGSQREHFENIVLKLGEPYIINATLKSGTQLDEVTITGTSDPLFNSQKNGASTNIGTRQIENLPTLSRSLQDFTRLTPQMSGANSFGGANNRYNNITIDGAVNNDVFGLSGSGTPGGPANTQPISLDAIQQIQVNLAPYDVSQGNFTGAGVNAVTRSGTNEFEGSAYYFGRNQSFVGKDPINESKYGDFTDKQYGVRLGGPIIKNKLFFFVNGEIGRRKAPLTNNAGDAGSSLSIADAQAIRDHALNAYGYDVGDFSGMNTETKNEKVFAKLDWNINSKHQLSIRHNFINASDDNINRTATFFRFGNNAYQFTNKQNVTIAELRSNFSSKFSNNLILGYSDIKDRRIAAGSLFPSITIENIGGSSSNSAEFGTQRSSYPNELDQRIIEFTDNFKIYSGRHTITVGTHNEFFKFRNAFMNNYVGRWRFSNLNDFLNGVPNRLEATFAADPDGDPMPAARFSAAQLSLYAQDEFEVDPSFKLTYGLRVDLPIYNSTPKFNQRVEDTFGDLGYSTSIKPKSKLLWSPRVGFNWDIVGDRSVQLRGGSGIFTGRVPFVWLSNQFSQDGVTYGNIDIRRAGLNGFTPNIDDYRNLGPAGGSAEINLVDPDFKVPQTWRNNLAVDAKLPGGIIGTLEGIYSKTINNIVYSDINIFETGVLAPELTNGADNRVVYTGGRVNQAFTNAILLSNTNKGYNYSLTAQLQKHFLFGLNAMVAYTNGKSTAVNDGNSSTAKSNWEFVQTVNSPNGPVSSYSNFDIRHRIVGSLDYSIAYGKNKEFATSFSLFYAGSSGTPFSFVYNGDLNGDGGQGNDLIYVPKDRSEINLVNLTLNDGSVITADQQWENLDAFINNSDYLNKKRGQYTERNGARMPWQHQFDLRIAQDLGILTAGKMNRLQITFDIFNVGNLINKKWGKVYSVGNNSLTPIGYSNGGYTFNRSNIDAYDINRDLASRWQGQIGLRYLFN